MIRRAFAMPLFGWLFILGLDVSAWARPQEVSAPNIRWDLSGEQIETLVTQELKVFERSVAHIAAGDGEGYDAVVGSYDRALRALAHQTGPATNLRYISSASSVRSASNRAAQALDDAQSRALSRQDFYRKFTAIDPDGLDEGQRQAMSRLQHLFEQHGTHLDSSAKRQRLTDLKRQVSDLAKKFESNVSDWDEKLVFQKGELRGLSDDAIASFRNPNDADQWVFPIQWPSYQLVMQYAEDGETRRRMLEAFRRRGGAVNETISNQVFGLRRQIASLLGLQHFADSILPSRMAKSGAAVHEFLADVKRAVDPISLAFRDALVREKQEHTGSDHLEACDVAYFSRLLRQKRFGIDPQEVRRYFPLDKVLSGMLEIYSSLFSLTFQRIETDQLWHPDVLLYSVQDTRSGKQFGWFYLDLFPRPGKFTHAAHVTIRPGGSDSPNIGLVLANFSQARPGEQPTLMFGEVRTLFHEFGHAMHMTLQDGTQQLTSLDGDHARDFVEAPSQMLENWVYEPQAISKMSSHVETGAKLPQAIVEALGKARFFGAGLHYKHQLIYSSFDMAVHGVQGTEDVDAAAIANEVASRVAPEWLTEKDSQSHLVRSFAHLMDGYEAGYYGYMWSEVFAHDMFSRFKAEGVLNPETGMSYRQQVLEPGIGRDPLKLIESFLGRKVSKEAFSRNLQRGLEGLAPSA